jgi:hypothetical protein
MPVVTCNDTVANTEVFLILFLDFDGVLHSAVTYAKEPQFSRLPMLEDILREYDAVEIVITSTWRIRRSLTVLRSYFSADIAARVIDVTPQFCNIAPIDSLLAFPRHAEIDVWLKQHNRALEPWVALDDRRDWFAPFTGRVVFCDMYTGLDLRAALELRAKLDANV